MLRERSRRSSFAVVLSCFVLSAVLALVAVSLLTSNDQASSEQTGTGGLTFPNLGSTLSNLADDPFGDHYGAVIAEQSGSMVAVSITVDGDTDPIVEVIERNGGDAFIVFDGYIEATVPTTALGALAQTRGVSWVRETERPLPAGRGNAISQGVSSHLANAWHRAGIKGQGVKIGVIDRRSGATRKNGYQYLRLLLGTDVPRAIQGYCYVDNGKPTENVDNCLWGGPEHGTYVAETVMDMAPEATLYIANPNSHGELRQTVEWMHSQGVDVIVHSILWFFHGPGDGTSPNLNGPLNTVKWAADNGIVWVNAAGNHNGRTWYGAFNDTDGNGYHEWDSNGNEFQTFSMKWPYNVNAFLRWDDLWPGAKKDLAIELYRYPGRSDEKLVATFDDLQNGGEAHIPYEKGWYEDRTYISFSTLNFGYKLKRNGSSTGPSWLQFVVWPPGGDISNASSTHSIMSPGDSQHPGMLTVGAANFMMDIIHETSSRGPTPTGYIKPDIAGVSCTRGVTDDDFCGSSAGAAHVAGLAALVIQQNPGFTPEQVTTYLKDHAKPLGDSTPNNIWGYGLAKLPKFDCVNAINATTSPTTTEGSWASTCTSAVDSDKNAHYYTFKLAQASTVTIDLSSSAVNTFLYLRNGHNNQAGKALAMNDDGGSGTNAQITTTLPPGSYTIEATAALVGQTGNFTLTTTGMNGPPTVSIAGGGKVTEGEPATFTVTASPTPTTALKVDVQYWEWRRTFGVTPMNLTVTIPANAGSVDFTVDTVDDEKAELNGSIDAHVIPRATYQQSRANWKASVHVVNDDKANCKDELSGNGKFKRSLTPPCPRRYHSFEVKRTSDVTIFMREDVLASVNPFMRLRSGKHNSKFYPYILRNDNGARYNGGGLYDARIDRRLAPGWYTIEAESGWGYNYRGYELEIKGLKEATDTPVVNIRRSVPDITEGEEVTFTLTANPAPASDLPVSIDIAATGDFGVSGHTVNVTLPGETGSKPGVVTFSIQTSDDRSIEPDGRITAAINVGNGYTASMSFGSSKVKVEDDDLAVVEIAAGPDIVESEAATFTVTSDIPNIQVPVTVTQTGAFLVGTGPWTYSVTTDADGIATLTVPVDDDSADEINGTVTAKLNKGSEYIITSFKGKASVIVTDDDPAVSSAPTVSVTPGSGVTEGQRVSFTLTASPAPTSDLTVYVTTAQDGWYGGIPESASYVIRSGQTTKLVTYKTRDMNVDEPDGAISMTVVDGYDYHISTSNGSAAVSVADNDDASACSERVMEDGTLHREWASGCKSVQRGNRFARFFTFYLEQPRRVGVFVSGKFDQYEYLRLGYDGRNTKEIAYTFPYRPDISKVLEAGWYTLEVTTYSQHVKGPFSVTFGGISTPNPKRQQVQAPEISIAAGADVTEGGAATFTLNATPAPASDLDVTVAISQSGDYITPGSQTVTIPTSGSKTFTVPTTDDSVTETDGSVTATVDTGTGYTVSSTAGADTVAVGDDDSGGQTALQAAIDSCVSNSLVVLVRQYREANRNNAPGYGLNWKRVLIAFGDVEDSELTPFTAAEALAGEQVWFGWRPIREALECIEAAIAPPPQTEPEISIAAGNDVTEGTDATFTVTATPAPSADLDVTVGVSQSGDYVTTGSRTVTITTTGSATFTVATTNDTTDEPDGSVSATISSGTGYTVSRNAGAATVAVSDDDAPTLPEISITASSGVTEGTAASFTLTASPTPAANLDITIAVSQSGDYVTTGSRTVTIPSSGSKTFTVTTTDDRDDEPDGSVTVSINNGSTYTVSSSSSTATVGIADNDTCAPTLPTDAVTITEITDWRDALDSTRAAAGIKRFNRVLATLGVDTGETPMTVQQAQAVSNWLKNTRWDRIARTLSAMESSQCDTQPPTEPVITITAGSDITEGTDATFTVTASPTPTTALTVNLTVSQNGNFGATTGTDTVIIPTTGSATFTVSTTNDSTDEPDGSVTATLSTGTGYTVSGSNNAATVSVSDDDPPRATPTISIAAGSSITEGADATFTVTASPTPTTALTVNLTVSQGGNFGATIGADTVTIPTTGSATFTVSTTNDNTDEPNGSITATLSTGTGYTVSGSNNAATVAVSDDDDPPPAPPTISIAAGSGVTEGGSATFTVTASPTPTTALTVNLTVSQSGNFGATTGADTVTIPTTGSATFTISTTNDNTDEPHGSVTATLSTGTGYTVAGTNNAATVAVSDDDDPPLATPTISIAAGSGVTEGSDATFTVTASPAPATALTVNLTVSQSGSFGATTGTDTVIIPTTGSATFTVSTTNDSTDEPDGSVTATLSTGTGYTVSGSHNAATVAVSDDDDLPPTISIVAGSGITEGSDASFTVTASPTPASALTVNVTISQSGSVGAKTGSRTITIPTSGSFTFTVSTTNDNTDEPNGSVSATVTTGSGYTVSRSAGSVSVAVSDDDDPQPVNLPTVSISDAQEYEDYVLMEFYLQLSHASSVPVTVTIEFEEGTATYGGDFLGIDTTQTIAPGQTRKALYVPLRADGWPEVDETFAIKLTSATGATIADDTGTGTILNDD